MPTVSPLVHPLSRLIDRLRPQPGRHRLGRVAHPVFDLHRRRGRVGG